MPGRRTDRTTPITLSFILPIRNQEETLPAVYHKLLPLLGQLESTVEFILIDDGSEDATTEVLTDLCARDGRFRGISLSRPFGDQAAITAGLRHARGKAVVVMNAGEDVPFDVVTRMIEKWREGYHVVYARGMNDRERTPVVHRMNHLLRRLLYKVAALPGSWETGMTCVLDRRVVDLFNALPERDRYLQGLRTWAGFRQTTLTFERQDHAAVARIRSSRRPTSAEVDGLLALSDGPLRLGSYIALGASASALLGSGVLIFGQVIGLVRSTVETAIILAVLLIGGTLLLNAGMIGAYLGRIYTEVKGRPLYVIRSLEGFDEPNPAPASGLTSRTRSRATGPRPGEPLGRVSTPSKPDRTGARAEAETRAAPP